MVFNWSVVKIVVVVIRIAMVDMAEASAEPVVSEGVRVLGIGHAARQYSKTATSGNPLAGDEAAGSILARLAQLVIGW